MRGAGGPDRGGEEAGEAPGRSSRAGALSRRRAGGWVGRRAGGRAGASRAAPFLGLHCPLSRGRRIAPPAPLASSRTEPAAEGLRGQLPRPPLIASQIATANKAEIPGAGSPAGIKAPSGACSNRTGSDVRCPRLRRHPRPSPCPLARLLPGLVRAGRSKGAEGEKSFVGPVGAAGFGGAGSWRRLPFVVSFIHKS